MIAALVPVKALSEAKGRLAAVLTSEERRRLALAMLADVVTALLGAASIAYIAIISPDKAVLREAERLRARPLPEPPQVRGINAALSYGATELAREGADTILVVPADLPTLTPAAVEEVLASLPSPKGVAIVPSVEGGTNVLALRPPDAIPFRFGPKSFTAHRREAVARSVPTAVLRREDLTADIDSPQDLLRLSQAPGAENTKRLLQDLSLPRRLGAGEEASE
ncbi:MAG TPA: 2-phospho-L-lactate guanylyltransferase [Dehalococcoidia bacterium]|nr:2-phospho-L-lactate guanylyltransferase [Dehalococcoidia bacterium]